MYRYLQKCLYRGLCPKLSTNGLCPKLSTNGSPESGVRFICLMSHFANIRKHNLDPVEYLCDVFRRIKKTAKDKLVDLLAHRWQLATVTSWA